MQLPNRAPHLTHVELIKNQHSNYSLSDAATAFSNESKKEEKSSAAQQLHACWLSATIDFVGAPGHES